MSETASGMASETSAPFDHRSFLKTVTGQPGVYQMMDGTGAVLYVGKAKNLRKRLTSYFRGRGLEPKTAALVARIQQIHVTVTNTEAEALLLEHNLIKHARPPYNILLRDDKSYPYIYLSTDQQYPRLTLHRGAKSGKGRYFGPYPSAGAVRESLAFLQKVFKVRQCEDSFFRNRSRPCLQHQIDRCTAPCVGAITPEAYAEDVRHTEMFLLGQNADLVSELADRMEQAAASLEFETAAHYRDQIQYLQQVQARQYIEGESGDLDIVACRMQPGIACIQLLCVRDGRILGSRTYFPKLALEESESDVLEAFMVQHYIGNLAQELPGELLVNVELENCEALEQAMQSARGRKVTISHRLRGNRARWLALAVSTAEQNLISRLSSKQTQLQRFEALQTALDLPEVPQRLECFDISHSSGEATVASCVVFNTDGPLKSDYRKFNIDGITPGDDYAAMHQALSRRYARLKRGEGKMPDILFIDGGKGQVAQAMAVLEELQISEVLVIGVAKGVDRKAGLEVLIRADSEQLVLPADSAALHLIQHIRDEAHRFAITGHKARRDKKRRESVLQEIPGVGPVKRRELLRHFGGLQGISRASVEDLCRVPGISRKLAEDIRAAFQPG
ncbi:MAG: excinuclease ABC subunit UvrC [Spongiibacteraceae bacterium]|jgi:excinuclease ABC subunit C|nr:excinuclease ABC subunit UvrC [Spongiibacteraceae bacterium]